MQDWLRSGGHLADLLQFRARQGSRRTVQAEVRQAERDHLLLAAANAAGNDRRALRWLRGEQVPDQHLKLVAGRAGSRGWRKREFLDEMDRAVTSHLRF